MKSALFVTLLALMLLAAACSKTEVIKLGEQASDAASAQGADNTTQAQPASQAKAPLQTTNISGKTAVKCTDTDADDLFTSGRVTVKYNDGSKQDFVDECPVQNEIFITEYTCVDNNVKPKTAMCDTFCVAGICFQ